MKCLNKNVSKKVFLADSECAKKRWLFCACITFAFLTAVFFLPLWSVKKTSAVNSFVSDTAVSVVRVTKKMNVQNVQKTEPVLKKTDSPVIKKNESLEHVIEQSQEPQKEEEFSDETEDSLETESAGEFSSSPVVSEEIAAATTSYKSYALSRIASKKKYPVSARSKGQEGKVKLVAVINKDGILCECSIVSPCDCDALNEAAVNAVKKASPFKKMKEGMTELKLSFVMDFSLK